MRRCSIRVLMVLPVLAAAVAAASAGSAHAMSACSSGQILKSKSYVFALTVGPLEQMYTQAQVKAKHPKSGEVMLSGTMSGGMGGMQMSAANWRHLEVHICTSKGAVVMHAHPSIVVDNAKSQMMMTVPVATMEGIGEGASDYHYGNNVKLTTGTHITVTVTLNGEKVVFHTVVTKTTMAQMDG